MASVEEILSLYGYSDIEGFPGLTGKVRRVVVE